MKFWETAITEVPGDVGFYWAKTHMFRYCLDNSVPCYETYFSGKLVKDLEIFKNLLIETHKDLKSIYSRNSSPANYTELYMLISDQACVWIEYNSTTKGTTVEIIGLNEKLVKELGTTTNSVIKRNIVQKGSVYTLMANGNGVILQQFGVAGENLIPENYRPEVIEEYRHIVKDLNSPNPCGRIVILNGYPGTGKTWIVRSLLNEVPNGLFILVPSSMVSSLGDPGLLPALMREQRKGRSMILILEDADEALSSRKADNVSAISALLNFSDGIFGSLLDMRVVATTNIKLDDLDEAVMRPGRLCRSIEVGKLDHTQSQAIYTRLTGKEAYNIFGKGNYWTLGEVYALAKGSDSGKLLEVKKSKSTIGFMPENQVISDTYKTVGDVLEEFGLKPGDIISKNDNEVMEIDKEDVAIGANGRIYTWKQIIGEESSDLIDNDSDLIDEDPEDNDEETWD